MTVTRGTFCPAIVTMYSGMARLSRPGTVSTGAVQIRGGTIAPCSPPRRASSTPMTTMVTANAAGTAHLRANRSMRTQVSRPGPTSHGWATKPRTGTRHSSSTTPASMAWAIGVGMAEMSWPSRGHSPVITMRPPATANAPTAAGQPPRTTPVLASRAAPGVDQARVRGAPGPPAQPQDAEALGGADREQAGSGFGRGGADPAQAGQHDSERAGETDQRGEDAGQDRAAGWFGGRAGGGDLGRRGGLGGGS